MTFREAMKKAMVNRGMFESQADEIISTYINSAPDNSMMNRWDDNVNGYPENMQGVLWIGVKDYAAKWLEEKLPQAWFRPMFQYNDVELENMMKS